MADRERPVVVRVVGHARRDEQLARNAAHRREDAVVGDPAAAQLALDHLGTRDRGLGRRAHFASVRSPAKRAAWRPRMRAASTGSAIASAYPAIGMSATRQMTTPSAPMYAPTPKRVAPRRSAPTTTAAADSAPTTPPTAPAIVSGVSPIASPIAPPSAAPTMAEAPTPSTFEPRIPVIATEIPRPSPRQRPIVYQLPTRPV